MAKSRRNRSAPRPSGRGGAGWPGGLALCLAAVLLGASPPAAAEDAATTACALPAEPGAAIAVLAGPKGLTTADGAEIILAGIALPAVAGDAPPGLGDLLAGDAAASLRLLPTAPPDRYGRRIGLVLGPDGDLLQARLVGSGAAIVRPDTIAEACARALLALEAEARDTRSGLWRDSKIVSKATDKSSLLGRNGLYALIEGRIVSVGYGSRMVFLDFGRSFRTDFTVMVAESLVSRLREAGFPVESLEGRTVRVRGIIEESGGPAIRLADPLALELVDLME